MSNNSNSEGYGCIIIFMMLFLIPMLIDLINTLVPLVFLGGAGYCIYQLHLYNSRTSNVTRYFENTFGLNEDVKTIELPKPKEDVKSISAPNVEILQELSELKEKVNRVEFEKEKLRENRQTDINEALNLYADKIDKKNKQDVLRDLFGTEKGDYARSVEFEKQEFQKEVTQKKEELDKRSFKQGMEERFLEMDKSNHHFQVGVDDKVNTLHFDMVEGFARVDQKFLHLDEKIMTLKGFVTEKFAQMEVNFQKELSVVKDSIGRLRVELKQDISDTRVQFGNEIMRLDKQQLQIVGKLQEYETKLKGFSYEVRQIKLEAQHFAMRGEDMLNRANTLYQRHQADIKVISNEMDTNLQRMALHKGDFANRVGQAKLMLDNAAKDQHFALKDIGYERIGINMLRQEHQQRNQTEQLKMQNLIGQQRHLEERIRTEMAQGKAVQQLQHRLFMTKEDLRISNNRANLMRQEFSVLKRLSR